MTYKLIFKYVSVLYISIRAFFLNFYLLNLRLKLQEKTPCFYLYLLVIFQIQYIFFSSKTGWLCE